MSEISEHLERLIARRLDGELTPDERLELDRELIRSPELRAVAESYERIDRLAAAAIRQAVAAEPAASGAPAHMRPQAAKGRRLTWMIYAASAIAACIAALLFWYASPQQAKQTAQLNAGHHPIATPTVGAAMPAGPGGAVSLDGGIWYVNDPADRLDRQTNRNYIVVPGKDGQLYLLQLDHVREIQQEAPAAKLRFTKNPV